MQRWSESSIPIMPHASRTTSRHKKAGTPSTGDPASCGLDRPYRWWRWAERSQKTCNSLIPLIILGWRPLARRYLKRYMILIWLGGAAQALGIGDTDNHAKTSARTLCEHSDSSTGSRGIGAS